MCVGCLCTTSGWFKHSEPTRTTPSQRSRCVGCCSTSSGWYKHSEPQRTYTNHTITEIARCVGCLSTSSGWFKHSEPHHHEASTVCRVLLHYFGVVQAPRTYTNLTSLTSTELARCEGCLSTRSGWFKRFKHSEPNHPALVQKHPTHLASSVIVWFVLVRCA